MTCLVGIAGAEVVEDLIDVVAFPVAAGGDYTGRFAMGAQVEGEDVVVQLVKERGPGDSADFGVGVAMQEDGGFVGIVVRDPPGGDLQGVFGELVADGKVEGSEREADVEGSEAFEDPGGFAVGHARRAEEEASHEIREETGGKFNAPVRAGPCAGGKEARRAEPEDKRPVLGRRRRGRRRNPPGARRRRD